MADTILTRVVSALTGSTALDALTESICYEYPTDFNKLPCVTYKKERATTNHAFGGTSYAEKVISVDIWSNSADKNEQIAAAVTTALSFMLVDVEVDITEPTYKHKNIKYFLHE